MSSRFWTSGFWIFASLMVTLVLGLWLRPVSASSSLSDSRLSQLEFRVRSLQTQVNQLQGQSPNPGTSSVSTQPALTPSLGELSLDEQFDNLATLVIEINQRLIRLEDQTSTAVD